MKKFLTISLFLNFVLLASLAFVWLARQNASHRSAAPTVSSPATVPVVASVPVTNAAPAASPVSFRWNRLDALDYHVYVKNLRAIGCPETTLRAIVTADVHAAYAVRIRVLEKKLADLAGKPWSARSGSLNAESEWKSELQAMPEREADEVADLLGLQPAPVVAVDASEPAQTNDDEGQQDAVSPTVPLVFLDIDPAALGLDEDQMQAVKNLRQNFLDKVGGPNQDPNDPAYLARWQAAQPWADTMLRGTLGSETYAKYLLMQVKAQNQAPPAE